MRGDAAGALPVLDAAVQQWPDNAGARYLAGLAALQTGEIERAISQLREAVRAGQRRDRCGPAPGVASTSSGPSTEEAARFARSYVRNRGRERPEGYVIWARALAKQGEIEAAQDVIAQLEEEAGFPMEAAVERAALARELEGPTRGPGRHPGRRARSHRPGQRARPAVPGRGPRSRSDECEEAIGSRRGRDRGQPGRRRAFSRWRGGFTRSAAMPTPLARPSRRRASWTRGWSRRSSGLASLAASVGQNERAVELFDEAAAADPEDPAPAYAAAQLVLGAGRKGEAEQRLRAIVSRYPGAAGARNDLAWLLAESGRELELALELAEDAARMDPQPTRARHTGLRAPPAGRGRAGGSGLSARPRERPRCSFDPLQAGAGPGPKR